MFANKFLQDENIEFESRNLDNYDLLFAKKFSGKTTEVTEYMSSFFNLFQKLVLFKKQ